MAREAVSSLVEDSSSFFPRIYYTFSAAAFAFARSARSYRSLPPAKSLPRFNPGFPSPGHPGKNRLPFFNALQGRGVVILFFFSPRTRTGDNPKKRPFPPLLSSMNRNLLLPFGKRFPPPAGESLPQLPPLPGPSFPPLGISFSFSFSFYGDIRSSFPLPGDNGRVEPGASPRGDSLSLPGFFFPPPPRFPLPSPQLVISPHRRVESTPLSKEDPRPVGNIILRPGGSYF